LARQKNAAISIFWLPLKGQCHEIFSFCFFHESVSPQPWSIALGPFQIFSKICGDICKSRCTTSINDTGGKFFHQFPSTVDTSGKFATGVYDTGSKFATGVVDTGGAPCLANISANFLNNSNRSK